MKLLEKREWVVVPSFFVIGLGILAIKYPHALDGWELDYDNSKKSFIFSLLFSIFLKLAWSIIGGTIAIMLSTLAIVLSFLSDKNEASEKHKKTMAQSSTPVLVGVLGFRAGKAYAKRRLRNQQPANQEQVGEQFPEPSVTQPENSVTKNKNSSAALVSSIALRAGKAVGERLRNKQPTNQEQVQVEEEPLANSVTENNNSSVNS